MRDQAHRLRSVKAEGIKSVVMGKMSRAIILRAADYSHLTYIVGLFDELQETAFLRPTLTVGCPKVCVADYFVCACTFAVSVARAV